MPYTYFAYRGIVYEVRFDIPGGYISPIKTWSKGADPSSLWLLAGLNLLLCA